MRRGAAALLSLALAGPAAAEGLEGRMVHFNAGTWDDPAAPYLISSDYVARVGPGPEFGMTPEGFVGLDVVPVTIDVSADRITYSYENAYPGVFAEAVFNGYILTFPAECTLIEGATIAQDETTLPLDDDDLTIEAQRLLLNLSALPFDTGTRITIDLDVTDCLLG